MLNHPVKPGVELAYLLSLLVHCFCYLTLDAPVNKNWPATVNLISGMIIITIFLPPSDQ